MCHRQTDNVTHNTLSKLYEGLTGDLESSGGLHEDQLRFCKGKYRQLNVLWECKNRRAYLV